MSTSRRFTGCIYSKPPDTMQSRMDLTRDELLEMEHQGRLRGLPVHLEHQSDLMVGRVLEMWHDPSDNFFVDFVLNANEEGGRRCLEMISDGSLMGLSLSHEYRSRRPLEVSLCSKGYRDRTWIINASGRQYETGPGVSMDVNLMEPPAAAVVPAAAPAPVDWSGLLAGLSQAQAAAAPAPAQAPVPAPVPAPVAAAPVSLKRTADEAGLGQETSPKRYETPLHALVDSKGTVTPENVKAIIEFTTGLAREAKLFKRQLEDSRGARIAELAATIENTMKRQGVARDVYAHEIQRLKADAAGREDGVEIMAASARAAQLACDAATKAAEKGDLWQALSETVNMDFGRAAAAPAPVVVNASAGAGLASRGATSSNVSPQHQGADAARCMASLIDQFDRQCGGVGTVYHSREHRPIAVRNFRY